jgi:hypothetical protein
MKDDVSPNAEYEYQREKLQCGLKLAPRML